MYNVMYISFYDNIQFISRKSGFIFLYKMDGNKIKSLVYNTVHIFLGITIKLSGIYQTS